MHLSACKCVTEEEKERWSRETRGKGRQKLSQPSHDLIKAIHHIRIIRQQHGSHGQSPSVRTHVHTNAFTPICTSIQKTREEGPSTVSTGSIQDCHSKNMFVQNLDIITQRQTMGNGVSESA